MGPSMTVGEWLHRLAALVGLTTSEGEAGVQRNSQLQKKKVTVNSKKKSRHRMTPPDLSTCHMNLSPLDINGDGIALSELYKLIELVNVSSSAFPAKLS